MEYATAQHAALVVYSMAFLTLGMVGLAWAWNADQKGKRKRKRR